MHNPGPIFDFLVEAQDSGKRTALVTIIAVTGGTSRNPGTHMAVADDGSYAGSFSGGCIEAAVVTEAVDVIHANAVREVRFGAGSPYIDIRLPCGGSVDLLFNPISDGKMASHVLAQLRARRAVSIRLPRDRSEPCIIDGSDRWTISAVENGVDLTHIPPLRVAIFGQGAAVEALWRQASVYGAQVEIFTPDDTLIARINQPEHAHRLATPASPIVTALDKWTAAIFLFHDHDWEPHLLKKLLPLPLFFIGAMGSRITHEHRLKLLRELGVEESRLTRIVSPVGLIPSSRDPETLAVSALAQIVADYHHHYMNNGTQKG